MSGNGSRAAAAALAAATLAIIVTALLRHKRRLTAAVKTDTLKEEEGDDKVAGALSPEGDEVELRLAELFENVKRLSRGVCLIVSNKSNTSFSASNLATYLKQKKLAPHSGATPSDVVKLTVASMRIPVAPSLGPVLMTVGALGVL